MNTPVVALVGRPNVGKSSLFNRLVGKSLAIVYDEPGVTRDRHYADVFSRGRTYLLVDTGGFDPESDDPMRQRILSQVALAVGEADVIVCVLDASSGPTEADREAVAMLRRTTQPVIYVANKADTPALAAEAGDLYRLGIDRVLPISATHGLGIADLESAVADALPADALPADALAPDALAPNAPAPESGPRVAIIGRPNAGKSSLVNRLLGTDRMLVDDRPGTTRDAIDSIVERDGRRLVIVDTAGIRRKARVAHERDPLEAASVLSAIRTLERSELALLVCDAAAGVSEQDAKILGLAVDRGRGIVVALNKIDLLDETARRGVEEKAREKLSFVPWAPMVAISARTGRGMTTLWQTLGRVHGELHRRVPTGELNRFFEQALMTRPPPTMGNRAPRLFYITQAETAPPLFVVMTNEPDHIHFSYRRFIINQIRTSFGFEGVPVRVVYKKRRRRER